MTQIVPLIDPTAGSDGAETFETTAPEQVRRRGETLVALGRRAIAAPSWRMLAYDAAALVAETLDAEFFSVAELSDDRSTLTVRISAVGEHQKDIDVPAHLTPCDGSTSLAGFALSIAQPVGVTDFAKEERFDDRLLRCAVLRALQLSLYSEARQPSARWLSALKSRVVSRPTKCSISKPSPTW